MEIEEDKKNDDIEIDLIDLDVPIDSDEKNKKDEQSKVKNNIIIIENEEFFEAEKEKEKVNEVKKILITKYSSLEPNLFLNENILDYKCISCGLIPSFEKANETICCGYLICGDCLKRLNDEKKGCPFCNMGELKTRDIKKENKIFCKSFKNLIIKCPYKCDWIGMWVDLESHLNECKLGYRECKYKSIGCEYLNNTNQVNEHEKSNDKHHLNLALKFIKDKNIVKKTIKFENGETCMTTCHPHIMTYMISSDWICDGRKLEKGCYSTERYFSYNVARFRCVQCDFDLCDKCIVHYVA